eukprot:m.232940 g.232940  ORF g.232940 m.232940 type:complete len:64 (+) comp42520_c0_seq1:216-407(+)
MTLKLLEMTPPTPPVTGQLLQFCHFRAVGSDQLIQCLKVIRLAMFVLIHPGDHYQRQFSSPQP